MAPEPREYLKELNSIHELLKLIQEKSIPIHPEDLNFISTINDLFNQLQSSYFETKLIERKIIEPLASHEWHPETEKLIIDLFLTIGSQTEEFLHEINERFNIVFPRCNDLIKKLTRKEFSYTPDLFFMAKGTKGFIEIQDKNLFFPLTFFTAPKKYRNCLLAHELFHFFFNLHDGEKICEAARKRSSFIFQEYKETQKWIKKMLVSYSYILSIVLARLGQEHNRPDLIKMGESLQNNAINVCNKLGDEITSFEIVSISFAEKLEPILNKVKNELVRYRYKNLKFHINFQNWINKTLEKFKTKLRNLTLKDVDLVMHAIEEGFAELFVILYSDIYKEKFRSPPAYNIFCQKASEIYKRDPDIFCIFLDQKKFEKIIPEFITFMANQAFWTIRLRQVYSISTQ